MSDRREQSPVIIIIIEQLHDEREEEKTINLPIWMIRTSDTNV